MPNFHPAITLHPVLHRSTEADRSRRIAPCTALVTVAATEADAVVTGLPASPISRDRLTGAVAAAQAQGVADRLQVRTGDYSARSAHAHTEELIAQGLTEIFCFNDEMALGVMSALDTAGLACSAGMSVVGFDDLPMAALPAAIPDDHRATQKHDRREDGRPAGRHPAR